MLAVEAVGDIVDEVLSRRHHLGAVIGECRLDQPVGRRVRDGFRGYGGACGVTNDGPGQLIAVTVTRRVEPPHTPTNRESQFSYRVNSGKPCLPRLLPSLFADSNPPGWVG